MAEKPETGKRSKRAAATKRYGGRSRSRQSIIAIRQRRLLGCA